MADFAVEWRSFADDTFYCHNRPTSPLLRWPTNAKRLLDKIVRGDRLWTFVGCFQDVRRKNATFNLAQVFRVREIAANEMDEDDSYPPELFPREIRAEPDASVLLDPFIPVARVTDGVWHDAGVPIGTLHRGPRRLSEAAVRALEALIGPAAVDRLAAQHLTATALRVILFPPAPVAADREFKMKRILGWVIGWGLATIYSATLLLGDDQAPGGSEQSQPYSYKFSKHDFDSAGRTNFTLDVTLKRPDLVVAAALCDIRDEQQQLLGRFSLGNVNAHDAAAPVRFRINCLAKAYLNQSTIRVEIREKGTNKHVGVLEISLRDAVPEVIETSVKER